MDPKSIANLDPKLRETYERVMGSSQPTPTASTPAAPDNATAPLTPTPDASLSTTPSSTTPPPPDFSAPVSPAPDAQLSPSLSGALATNPNIPAPSAFASADSSFASATPPSPAASMQPLASPATVAQTAQGAGSLTKVLYIFGGIVFFIVYVFFWVKIFNYSLPF